jgi:hypothetical protein
MRTAIFVYEHTTLVISTCESDLQLCSMNGAPGPLSAGDNTRMVVPGIYKIVSSQDVHIKGDLSSVDISVTTFNKDNDPKPPPIRASTVFAPLDAAALQTFLAVPEAKGVAPV